MLRLLIASVYQDAIHNMSKENKKVQANYRLPENLLEDLKLVSDPAYENKPQTEIVQTAIEQKVRRLKNKHKLGDNVEAATV